MPQTTTINSYSTSLCLFWPVSLVTWPFGVLHQLYILLWCQLPMPSVVSLSLDACYSWNQLHSLLITVFVDSLEHSSQALISLVGSWWHKRWSICSCLMDHRRSQVDTEAIENKQERNESDWGKNHKSLYENWYMLVMIFSSEHRFLNRF